jgi:carbamoyltransferase
MYILGINAYHGDAAAAIIKDGRLIAAAEEERFNRIKHCAGFPEQAIRYCLEAAAVRLEDVDHIGVSRDPSAHLHKKILYAASRLGVFRQAKDRLANAARVRDVKDELARAFGIPKRSLRAQFHNVEHHLAHLASCFFVSPFERAALLSIDGFGDFISTMWAGGEGNAIEVLGQVEYPHSTGVVYTATTQFLGFPHYGDEGKVMGLAPYGEPRFINQFREIIRTEERGQFRLQLDYFRHHAEGVEMTWDQGSPVVGRIFSDEFVRAFGPARAPGSPLTDRERDLAASLQLRLEEIAFHVLHHLYEQTKLTDLGLAGGVAYNSVMNGKILLNTPFRRLFIQPAAGDSGTALGVCYHLYNQVLQQARSEAPAGAYYGPEFNSNQLREALDQSGLEFESYDDHAVTKRAARDIAAGLVVGWFQGRMEFGPRALGNRSFIADPRRSDMRELLNEKVKLREWFRPLAPSMLAEAAEDLFGHPHYDPFMITVLNVLEEKRAAIPSVVHVDGTARPQTVS